MTKYDFKQIIDSLIKYMKTNNINTIQHYCIIRPHRKPKKKHLAIGTNKLLIKSAMISEHAEVNAIISYKKTYNISNKDLNLDLFVFRLSKTGIIGYSRPCYNCILYCMKCGLNIIDIHYSLPNWIMGKERLYYMLNSPKTTISSGTRKKNNLPKLETVSPELVNHPHNMIIFYTEYTLYNLN
jgi:hypothetical protein